MSTITVESKIHFERRGRGARRVVENGPIPVPATYVGRVPRITRLMALAIRFDELIRGGEVADYSELAKLGNVSRARVTQIMNLLMLAPDIQEQILHLPRVTNGRDPINLRQLQPIALVPDWRRQRHPSGIIARIRTGSWQPARCYSFASSGEDVWSSPGSLEARGH